MNALGASSVRGLFGEAAGLGEGVGTVWWRNDNVIDDWDLDVAPCVRKMFSDLKIFRAWCGVAGRMRVREDDAGGAHQKGVSKDQFGVNDGATLPPTRDELIAEDGELSVEG